MRVVFSRPIAWLVALVFVFAAGCASAEPREVVAGEHNCGFCRMEITDTRFATQVVNRTGKVHHFDSVECLVGFVAAAEPETVRNFWVTDVESPGTFRPAGEAGYLLDGSVRGPMGRAVAFASPESAIAAQQRLGGATVSWSALLADSAGIRSHAGH